MCCQAQRFPSYEAPEFPDTVKFHPALKFFTSYQDFDQYQVVDTIVSPDLLLVMRFDSLVQLPRSGYLSGVFQSFDSGKISCYTYFIAKKRTYYVELYAMYNWMYEFPIRSKLPCTCQHFPFGLFIDKKNSNLIHENMFVVMSTSTKTVTASQGYSESVTRMQLWNMNDFTFTTLIPHLKYEWWPYGDGFYATNSGGAVFYDYPFTISKDYMVITDEMEKKYKYFFNGRDLILQ
jgi:hypothetical protein